MIMKQLTIALLVMLLSGCTMERTNRTLTQYGNDKPELLSVGEESVEATAEISLETIEKRKQLADLAKKNHGLMHIHRYGPGFDVLMTLDAGDSDVIFSMKLPLASGEDRETLHSSAEDIVEKNKQVLASLDDEKSELHHEELNERSELIEQKKIQDFQASTKHIFSAQSLFYKKQYWQSLDETNKALELVPSSAQAHALKGSIYYKMGLSEEAKTSWQQALALDPTMEHVKTSLTRLK
jgi:tetratricopeptide (TPR) repeat protein